MKKSIITVIGSMIAGFALCLAAARFLPIEDEDIWF